MASTVPAGWMPAAKMTRIIVHWTAGTNNASATDREHYHFLIDGAGKLVRGDPSVKSNEAPLKDGYAAHTRNCNTGSIGISLCGMAGAVQSPFSAGKYPLKMEQWQVLIKALADLCQAYGIKPTPKTVLTHAEVQANLGIKQLGKWDIAILPFNTKISTAKKVGDELRAQVAFLLA